jgi:hypothetical protein
MAVIIRPTFNASQIAKMIADKRLAIQNAIASGLAFIGETFVVNARNTNTYHDQTGNLRSSIGYCLYHNGEKVQFNFEGETSEGITKASELADEVAAEHPQGFVMVCVAGMEYAAAVESGVRKGGKSAHAYDVITNSSIIAVREVKEMVVRLKSKINRMP